MISNLVERLGTLAALAPALVTAAAAVVTLLGVLVQDRNRHTFCAGTAFAGLAAAGVAVLALWGKRGSALHGTLVLDRTALGFQIIILLASALSVALSYGYARRLRLPAAEYYPLLLIATSAMLLLAGRVELLGIFLSTQIVSVCGYVMAGFRADSPPSPEAAKKYLLTAAFAAALMLCGIGLIYGATGQTILWRIAMEVSARSLTGAPLFLAGLALFVGGLCFQAALVPFHFHTPDVYEAAPVSVAAFLSAAPKVAVFVVLLRLFHQIFRDLAEVWQPMVALLAVAGMTVGNVSALAETTVKRMLAYSAIAHGGYALIAIVAASTEVTGALAFYLLIYTLAQIGAFAVATTLASGKKVGPCLGDLAGLANRNMLLALAMTVFMLSLIGLPPTAGFLAKFYVFGVATAEHWVWLVIVALLNSVVSAYYYLRVVNAMFSQRAAGEEVSLITPPLLLAAIYLCALALIYLGLFPAQAMQYTVR